MRVLVSHPTGNQNVRNDLQAFYSSNVLQSYHTCVSYIEGRWYEKILFGPLKRIKRKTYNKNLESFIYQYPCKEILRQILLAFHLKLPKTLSIDAIYDDLDKKTASYIDTCFKKISCAYAFEDGALNIFETAKKHEIKCVYNLSSGYWRLKKKIIDEEREKNKDWSITIRALNDDRAKLDRKDNEIRLSDLIIVASNFTKKSLELYPGELPPIVVLPYGFPQINKERKYENFYSRKIKVLYVGNLSQQKGISYMANSLKDLWEEIEMTVVGSKPNISCEELDKFLEKVTYINYLPHTLVLDLMSKSDILIFPSLFDGFGMVVSEAMSQGTPVIASDHSCATDIITDKYDGWIVPAGNSNAINVILKDIIKNKDLIKVYGKRAMEKASKYSWDIYQEKLISAIRTIDYK